MGNDDKRPTESKGLSGFNSQAGGVSSIGEFQKRLRSIGENIQRQRAKESEDHPLWSTLWEATDRPTQPGTTDHYPAARAAIYKDKEVGPDAGAAVVSLAIELWKAEADLWKHLGINSWVDRLLLKFSEQVDPTHPEYNYTDETKTPAESLDETPMVSLYGTPAMFETELQSLAGADDADADMLPLAERVAGFLQTIGKKGREIAEKVRKADRKAWEDKSDLWVLFRHTEKEQDQGSAPIRNLRYLLARALWEDAVRPPLERRSRLIAPAITEATSDLIIQVSQPGVLFTPDGQALRPEGIKPRTIEGIVPQIEEVDVQFLKTDTIHFWLSVLAEVTHAFDRYVATGTVDNQIVLPGGWRELIDMVNKSLDWNLSTSSATQRRMKQAIQAQAHLEFKIGPKRGNLLAYSHNENTNELTLTLGDMLLPLFGQTYDDSSKLSHSQRKWVNLVPVTKPASLQPFRAADRGKALSFQHVLIAYAREQREDILDGRGIDLNPIMLPSLAAKARMPRPEKAIDAWTIDADDSPALLEKVGRHRYMIADNDRFGPARRMIEQAANKTRKARFRQQLKRQRDKESKLPTPEGDAP